MLLAYNNYLFKCDLLYKRNEKSVHNFIKLNNLTIKISLSEFTNEVSLFSSFKFSELDNYNKILLVYYINYFFRPNIFFKQLKEAENTDCILTLKLFKNNLLKFLFFYFKDLYLYLFEFFLQITNVNYRSKTFFFKGNLLNNSEFHFYLNEILELVNLKKLSFCLYLDSKY